MATVSSAEDIQREMREVRADLRGNVQEIIQQAGGLTDWQEYVKAYPWLALGAAAMVGFLVVPSRPTIIHPDSKQLLELAKSQKVHLEMNQPAARSGIVGSLVGMAGSFALQAGMSALSTYLAQLQSPPPSPQDGLRRDV